MLKTKIHEIESKFWCISPAHFPREVKKDSGRGQKSFGASIIRRQTSFSPKTRTVQVPVKINIISVSVMMDFLKA